MTKEEIIEMACQAFGGVIKKEVRDIFIDFAKLIAQKEREECAQVCEQEKDIDGISTAKAFAEIIRARGKE